MNFFRQRSRGKGARPAAFRAEISALLFLLLVFCPLPSLAAPHNGVIVFGSDHNYPPYEFLDKEGQPAGFNVDMIRAIGEVMGFAVKIELGPWAAIRQRLEQEGTVHVSDMFYSEERAKIVDFADPFTVMYDEIYIRRDSEPVRDLEDLPGRRVAVESGSFTHEYLVQHDLGATIIPVESEPDALRAVAAGDADCAIISQAVGQYSLSHFKLYNLVATGSPLFPREYSLVVAKGNAALLRDINQGLAILKATGGYEQIKEKWLTPSGPWGLTSEDLARAISRGMFVLLCLSMVILFWMWRLKRQLSRQSDDLKLELAARREAEKKLEQSAMFLRNLIDSIPDLIFYKDHEGRYLGCNSAFEELVNRREDEIIGRTDFDLFPRDEALSYRKKDQQMFAANQACRNDEWIVYPDGRRVLLDTLKTPFYGSDDEILGMIGLSRDITEYRETTKEVRRLSYFYELLLDSAGEGIIGLDSEGRVTFINPCAMNILGFESEEILGREFHGLIRHSDVNKQYLDLAHCRIHAAIRDKTITHGINEYFFGKGGQGIAVNYSSTPVMDNEVIIGVVITFQDVTERQNLESRLRQAQKMEAIGTLAGGIAHDFNNILTIIIGYSEMALLGLPVEIPVRRDITQVLKAAGRAKELVQQILSFSRRTEQELKPIGVASIVKETLKLLKVGLPATIDIQLTVDAEEGTILGDPTQMHQVVMNLCTNAYHAMLDTGGSLRVAVRNGDIGPDSLGQGLSLPAGRYLLLTVADTGMGMDRHTMDRIFEPYFTTKEKGKGTGLGLAMVHGIVEKHGGCVTVASEIGRGSTFTVYLPVLVSPHPEEESVAPGDTVARGTERILVVDDEEPVASALQLVLESLGYQVTAMVNSEEALQLFVDNPAAFDLVLTDLSMPKLPGDQLARRILSARPEIPVVLLTGFNELISREDARKLGIREYALKPVGRSDLAALVRRVLDENPPPDGGHS